MSTSSPSFKSARQRLKQLCLPPELTRICFSVKSRPLSRRYLATIAFFSEGVPPVAVYLVKPLAMAAVAASLICWGVSKSGSPAPRPMTSLPGCAKPCRSSCDTERCRRLDGLETRCDDEGHWAASSFRGILSYSPRRHVASHDRRGLDARVFRGVRRALRRRDAHARAHRAYRCLPGDRSRRAVSARVAASAPGLRAPAGPGLPPRA